MSIEKQSPRETAEARIGHARLASWAIPGLALGAIGAAAFGLSHAPEEISGDIGGIVSSGFLASIYAGAIYKGRQYVGDQCQSALFDYMKAVDGNYNEAYFRLVHANTNIAKFVAATMPGVQGGYYGKCCR